MDLFEDIYFWSKNGRPDAGKDQDFNSLCHMKMRHRKSSGTIVKTYHIDFGELQIGKKAQNAMDKTVFRQDLAPYVAYSVNKKKRWEVAEIGKMELLGEIQKMYDEDVEVLVLDRVELRSPTHISGKYYFHDLYFDRLPIRKIHEIHDDNSYQCTSTNSFFGHKIEHFSPENRSSNKTEPSCAPSKVAGSPKVAYHFMSRPKNYEVLLQKHFHPGRLIKKWWWPLDFEKLDFQTGIDEDYYEWITYDGLMDREWDDVHEWDEEDYVEDKKEPEKKCYNLVDHIVDEKWKVVKRRRN